MFEAVVTSDWHLVDSSKHFSNHLERQMYEIEKIYQYAYANGIEHMIVDGDVSDTPSMGEDPYIALLRLLKKHDSHIKTYYIPGNHDFSDIRKTSMDLLYELYVTGYFKNFTLCLKPETRIIDNVPINFLPYPCLEAPKSKRPALNLSHVAYNGALGDNGRKLRVNNEFIQNPGDFNVSGHIHTYQHLKSKRAIYCGSPYQKNFGESLPKGFVHLKVKGHKSELQVRHKFIDNKPEFQFINLVIEKRSDYRKLVASESMLYKLWIAPGVEIPKDLRIQYPNITGGVFGLDTKVRRDAEDDAVNAAKVSYDVKNVDIRDSLKQHIKNAGHSKDFYKMALQESRVAANQLGVSFFQ